MIDIALYILAGFLAATLIALLTVPLATRRARKRAMRSLNAKLPYSLAELAAEKDLMRAEFAVSIRRVEIDLAKKSEKLMNQTIELQTLKEKLLAAQKITRASKIALDEIHSKEINLNDQLRAKDAQYAGLEQRSRQILRENRALKTRLQQTNGIPENGADPVTSEQERPATIDIKAETDKIGHREDTSDSKLPIAILPVELGGTNQAIDSENQQQLIDSDNVIALAQDQILTLAAELASITAQLEGKGSPIHNLLSESNSDPNGTLAERMKALIETQPLNKNTSKKAANSSRLPVASVPENLQEDQPLCDSSARLSTAKTRRTPKRQQRRKTTSGKVRSQKPSSKTTRNAEDA